MRNLALQLKHNWKNLDYNAQPHLAMKRYLPSRAAFTLLEIMLVVLIIGSAHRHGPALHRRQARRSAPRQSARRSPADQTNLMMYQAANGFYPSTEQGLKALVQKPDGDPKPRNWRQLDDQVPRDPWDQEYFYRFPPASITPRNTTSSSPPAPTAIRTPRKITWVTGSRRLAELVAILRAPHESVL
ncbi:MAG: type II secretion system protein GspG [Chthoniobacter sp.]